MGETTPGKCEGERFETVEGRCLGVEDSRWIKEERCLQIINSGILTYKGKQGLRVETPKA
jgi:hypothetical protein